jgi:hypothetical protein
MTLLAEMVELGRPIVYNGVTMGSALAMVCSWQRNRSIIMAVIAGVFSWFYVLYFALTRRPDEIR